MKFLALAVLFFVFTDAKATTGSIVVADTITPDYSQAVDFCLLHQYPEAETLLLQISRRSDHPNRDAAILLLTEEVYVWRGNYRRYISFCDSIAQQLSYYTFAKRMLSLPPAQIKLLADSTRVNFTLKKKGHVIVEILINGKPKKFMIDTGAQRTAISNKLAKELGLPQLVSTSVRNSLGQSIPSSIVQLDSIRLADLNVSNLPVFKLALKGFGVDGALGWDVLQHLCFTVDYKARRLTLRTPKHNGSAVKNLLGGSLPLIAFRSKTGDYLHLFLDTGSNDRVSLSPTGLTKIGTHTLNRRPGFQFGFGGKFKFSLAKHVKQTEFRINDKVFSATKTRLTGSDHVISSVIIDGIVGSRQFSNGRLTVDFINNHFNYAD